MNQDQAEANSLTIGVVSDTHGLLRPEAVLALEGVDLIIHAGDVGRADLLDELRKIAPVHAVRGNVDRTAWAMSIPETEVVKCGRHLVYVLHDLNDIDLDPHTADIKVVVSGHTHRPQIEHRNGVIFLNPGSIGPRRFGLPISLAKLSIEGNGIMPELIELTL